MKKTIAIVFLFNLLLHSEARTKDGETRTAVVSYEVSKMDVVNIQAKYTDLTVEAWEKDEVLVEATLRYDGKITDKIQKFLDSFEEEVKDNIKYEGGELVVKTNLDEPNKFQLGSKHVGIVISFKEDELKIEYTVKVPASNEVKIRNSYRDLYMNGSFEDVVIDQYSGDLKAETINQADIRLKYGSAQFDDLTEAKMELYEQDVKANRIGTLTIDTKYSELKISQLGNTEITSYESDFEIGSLVSLEGSLKYGKMEVTERMEEGELTTYEFDIEAEEIGSLTFIDSKYGKYEANKVENLELIKSYEDDFEVVELGILEVDEQKYDNFNIGVINDQIALIGYEGEVIIDRISTKARKIAIEGKYIETALNLDDLNYKLIVNTKYGKNNIDRSSANVTRYIKDGDKIEIEVSSNKGTTDPVIINISGYEMDLELLD